VVHRGAPLDGGGHQAGLAQHGQVLGHGLPGHGQAVVVDEPHGELEEALVVPRGELLEQDPPRGMGQRLEQDVHTLRIGNPLVANQVFTGFC
jgi:hypothetical protein